MSCRSQSIPDLIPIEVKKDGSCLFNAVVWSLYGSQSRALELRIRTCLFMSENPDLFNLMALQEHFLSTLTASNLSIMLQSSVSDKDFVAGNDSLTIENRSRTMLRSSEYASVLEIYYLVRMLEVEITLIYPSDYNLFTQKELFSGVFKPPQTSRPTCITIAWTSTDLSSVQDLAGGKWRPNHFVPCILRVSVSSNDSWPFLNHFINGNGNVLYF